MNSEMHFLANQSITTTTTTTTTLNKTQATDRLDAHCTWPHCWRRHPAAAARSLRGPPPRHESAPLIRSARACARHTAQRATMAERASRSVRHAWERIQTQARNIFTSSGNSGRGVGTNETTKELLSLFYLVVSTKLASTAACHLQFLSTSCALINAKTRHRKMTTGSGIDVQTSKTTHREQQKSSIFIKSD